MDDILEKIEKMSRAEQQTLIDQIYCLWDEADFSEREADMLRARAQEAKRNGFPGHPAEDVLADLEKEEEVVEDEEFIAELRHRINKAIANPQSGTSWANVKARLSAKQSEQGQQR